MVVRGVSPPCREITGLSMPRLRVKAIAPVAVTEVGSKVLGIGHKQFAQGGVLFKPTSPSRLDALAPQ